MYFVTTALQSVHGPHNKTANPNNYEINELLLADYQYLINENEDELQNHIKELNSSGRIYGMKISTEKSETMIIRREPINHKITMEN